jgi:hypothetical protein
MRSHKLGDAQRAWEVIRPLLSLLLWMLPEHIITAQELAPPGNYTKAVAPVSADVSVYLHTCIGIYAHQFIAVCARPSTHRLPVHAAKRIC